MSTRFHIKKLIIIALCAVTMLTVYLWMRIPERDDTARRGWPAAITWDEPYVGYINVSCHVEGCDEECDSKLFLRGKNASICLPSFAAGRGISLDFDEKYFDLYIDGERCLPKQSVSPKPGSPLKILYTADAYGTIERSYTLDVLISENLPALYLSTGSGSMEYMDADKEHLDSGQVAIFDENGTPDTAARISFMHAKGQSSFTLAKKSYKLELARDCTPLGLTLGKKWVLVANSMDTSLMRNALAYSLAGELGIEDALSYRFVDAWFNGEYRGNYMLVEAADRGFMEKYANNKSDFLLEVETWEERLKDESTYLKRGESEWMEFLWPLIPDEAMIGSAGAVLDRMDSVTGNIRPGDDLSELRSIADPESFAKKYLLDTLTNEPDSNSHSTFYYYSPENGGLHAAPVWDYDRGWGNRPGYNDYPEFESYTHGWQQQLMKNEDFNQIVKNELDAITPYLMQVSDSGIDDLARTLAPSQRMDYCVNGDPISTVYNAGSYEANTEYLKTYYRESFESLSDYLNHPEDYCILHFESPEGRALRVKKGSSIGAERMELLKNLYKCSGFKTADGTQISEDQILSEDELTVFP